MNELTEGMDALAAIRKHEKILKDIEGILAIALEYPESDEPITGNKAWGLAYEAAYKIKEIKNPHDGSTLNDFLLEEEMQKQEAKKEKNMSKLYIVVRQDYGTGFGIFCKVFFKRALAEDWINSRRNPEDYNIETYQEQEDGTTLEVYEI